MHQNKRQKLRFEARLIVDVEKDVGGYKIHDFGDGGSGPWGEHFVGLSGRTEKVTYEMGNHHIWRDLSRIQDPKKYSGDDDPMGRAVADFMTKWGPICLPFGKHRFFVPSTWELFARLLFLASIVRNPWHDTREDDRSELINAI